MRCSKCSTDNPEKARFCIECAARLGPRCPKCDAENSLNAKFCAECATPLSRLDGASADVTIDSRLHQSSENRLSETSTERIPEAQLPARGERRHLTILFSDLVGSTEMAAKLDLEEWGGIAGRYQRAAADAAQRFGGYVAQYLGDGLVVYFGYPQAHEDDAEQAVRGGLAILYAVASLNEQLSAEQRSPLRVRVGIHTGSVVIGEGGGGAVEMYGEVPNIAARLQAAAEPDTLLITAAVHRLVSGMFVFEDRGAQALKGVIEPMQLYRVLRPSGVRGRLRAAALAGGLTPFVGREDELRMLLNRWERVQEDEGHVVMVVGEAGIGKSRLIEQFHEKISDTRHTWIECAGASSSQNTPFFPIIGVLQQLLTSRSAESPDGQTRHLERALKEAGLKPSESLPFLAGLLNLPVSDRYPMPLLPPQQRHRKLLTTLATLFFAAARTQPVVIVVEDLHWVDPSTLDLQELLAEQGATAPLLLLYTARPEFRPPWPMRAHHLQLTLNRLSSSQTRSMVARMAVGERFANDVVDAVVMRSGGVPLFVEELTRHVRESSGTAVASLIPATLHDSLMARLDRLGSAKEVVQVGATIGREFSYRLIHAVLPIPDIELQTGLEKAAEAELLYTRGIPPDATYLFKHVLVQDAAYQALLKSKRKKLHRTIADVLSGGLLQIAAEQPELVAQHYIAAGETGPALSALQRAGDLAVDRGALKEAEIHYNRAISVLETMDDTPAHEQTRLTLQVALGQVLIVTKGYAAEEVKKTYSRARELAERLGNRTQLLFSLIGLWVSNLTRSELDAAQSVADEMLAVAESHRSDLLIWGHYANGVTRYHRGDLVGARTHVECAVSLYQEQEHRRIPQDPGVAALSYASRTAAQLGMADTARARIKEALALARRLEKPFGLAFAYSVAAGLYLLLREPDRARKFAEALIEIATEQHMAFYAADGTILQARAMAELDLRTQATGVIREGISRHLANGQRGGLGFYWAFLAEAQMWAGALDEALATIEEALTALPEETVDHPFLIYLRGEINLKRSVNHQHQSDLARNYQQMAEQSFRDAMAAARRIGAKLCELRAATSLGRMLKLSGQPAEAHNIVAPLYAGFSEGFDTHDLIAAKTLLTELTE
jgi:class 3 adenylate cyclase/tetratricopeptide (TPR) repeat protein